MSMTVAEAFRLAGQVTEMARAARRAEVLAYVNKHYLHGWDDDDVVTELEKLSTYIDAAALLTTDGALDPRADAVLKARWGRS